MSTSADKLVSQIKDLPDTEKLRLVDAILTELDKPDPEIDRIWAEEALGRLQSWPHFHGLVRRGDGQIPAMMEIRFLNTPSGSWGIVQIRPTKETTKFFGIPPSADGGLFRSDLERSEPLAGFETSPSFRWGHFLANDH